MATGEATWSDDLKLMLVNDGRRRELYFTFTYRLIIGAGGAIEGVFCPVAETTEQALNERRLRTLSSLAAALMDAQSVDIALDTVIDVCAHHPDGRDWQPSPCCKPPMLRVQLASPHMRMAVASAELAIRCRQPSWRDPPVMQSSSPRSCPPPVVDRGRPDSHIPWPRGVCMVQGWHLAHGGERS